MLERDISELHMLLAKKTSRPDSFEFVSMLRVMVFKQSYRSDFSNQYCVGYYPPHNFLNVLVKGAHTSNVMGLIIDGKLVMHERKVLTIDEEEILATGKREMERAVAKPRI